ncbi:MLP-like protein 31 [Silene latifolia]|uniref:MLP-like protein 31 n=1 Tax=Silene latifolia TaxID=37657 RepID=UPI003D76ACE2
MRVIGKFEVEVDIAACGGDVFHEIFSTRPHHIATMSPSNIHGCDVHEGDFGKVGSIIFWDYTLDGKKCVAKELIEEIDEEKQLVRFKIIDGDLLKEFKSFTLTVHVLPRGELTGVKWISEFEKIDESVPYPTKLIDFCIAVTKDIETHHLNEAKTEAAKTE